LQYRLSDTVNAKDHVIGSKDQINFVFQSRFITWFYLKDGIKPPYY